MSTFDFSVPEDKEYPVKKTTRVKMVPALDIRRKKKEDESNKRSLGDDKNEENAALDNDENLERDYEFVIELTSQNILRSKDQTRFRCICPCTEPFIRRNFLECQQHLKKLHDTKSITPKELCTSCLTTNLVIWQKRHECDKIHLRGKRVKKHWRSEDEGKY